MFVVGLSPMPVDSKDIDLGHIGKKIEAGSMLMVSVS